MRPSSGPVWYTKDFDERARKVARRVANKFRLAEAEAEDLTQAGLVKILRSAPEVAPTTAYLGAVFCHLACDLYRQKQTQGTSPDQELVDRAPDAGRKLEDALAARSDLQRLMKSPQSLNSDDAKLLIHISLGGSYEDWSGDGGPSVSKNALEARVSRLRKVLRDELDRDAFRTPGLHPAPAPDGKPS